MKYFYLNKNWGSVWPKEVHTHTKICMIHFSKKENVLEEMQEKIVSKESD